MVALAPTIQDAADFQALPRRRKLRLVWLFLRVLPYGGVSLHRLHAAPIPPKRTQLVERKHDL